MNVEEESEAVASSRPGSSLPAAAVHLAGEGKSPGQESEMLSAAPEGALEGELVDQRVWGAIASLRERGMAKKAVARELGLDIKTVRTWWQRPWEAQRRRR